MNKKGFTLVELIAVLVIIGIIFTIAFPLINKYLFKAREKTYDTYVETLYNATRSYLEKNSIEIPEAQQTSTFDSDFLQRYGFIDTLEDPEDSKKTCSGEVQVTNNLTEGQIRSNPDLTYKITLNCSRKTKTKTVD